jgi:hypothetical protein
VPKDRLLEPVYRFEAPSVKSVKEVFRRAHAASEHLYRGSGVWGESLLEGCPPMYRNTSRRIIGYAEALKAEGIEECERNVYYKRVLEGAEYLLREQQEDGSFLWWAYDRSGQPNTHHLLYCSAIAGCALLEAYRLSGEERYLDASRKACEWASRFPVSANTNYNSFAVWHLSNHYIETGEERFLKSAIERTVKGVYPRQLPNGAWAGHNSWIFYHSIIVRGFAALYGALPEDHEARADLKTRMTMAVNHMIVEQLPNGYFKSCWDRGEWTRTRDPKHPYSVHREEMFCPFTIHALVTVLEMTDLDKGSGSIENALRGALGSKPPEDLDGRGSIQLAYGAGYRWLTRRSGAQSLEGK